MITNNGYFNWLIGQVTAIPRPNMGKLYASLYFHEFIWILDRDRNRASDGVELRDQYMDSRNIQAFSLPELQQPCSVLEMMVALAQRCDFQTMTNYDDNKAWYWFDEMLKSLGLYDMDDQNFDEGFVDYVLNRWMMREHDTDGNGGLFYIPGFDMDMRKMEIWYQMCNFITSSMDLSI